MVRSDLCTNFKMQMLVCLFGFFCFFGGWGVICLFLLFFPFVLFFFILVVHVCSLWKITLFPCLEFAGVNDKQKHKKIIKLICWKNTNFFYKTMVSFPFLSKAIIISESIEVTQTCIYTHLVNLFPFPLDLQNITWY